ncbi:MAG: ATP-binding protein [Patescibacteria group bacterium]
MWLDTFVIIIIALAGLANLFLAIYVYKKNPGEKLNASFFYFGIVLFLWCLSNVLSSVIKDLFWLRSAYSMGSIVPLAGIFFGFTLADKIISNLMKISLFIIGFISFTISLFTPFVIKDIIFFSSFGFEATPGALFNVWGVYLIIAIFISLYVPIRAAFEVDEQRKKQILYYMTGAVIFALWSIFVSVILPFFGFTKISNIDSPATIFMAGFASYAIIKYNLMNIKSLFFQAFIYSLAIISIITLLLLLMLVSAYFFEHFLVWPIYIITAITSIVLFFIGRLFFMKKRDLEKAKINLTELLEKSEKNRIKAEMERDKTEVIVNNFSDGLILLNEKNEISTINPEAVKMLELETGELLKKPIRALAYFQKAAPILPAIGLQSNNVSKKEVVLAKDFIIELSVIPLNLDKNDVGRLIVLHDISRAKIVEKMKTEFVSLAAHQLRTPLSIIKWSMSMLEKGDFGKLAKKQRDVVKQTFTNNERLIFLVNDLLNVTRIEEGRYLYETAMADIAKIVNFATDYYKQEIKKKKIKVKFIKLDDLPQIMVDEEKIRMVVQNFLDNSIRYSREGGKIIISLENDSKNIKFKIQDFGMGIPKNQQDKIFTKFFRGDNATKVNTVGSGLGLFLAENIIEAHGGKIWFESEEHIGTSFYFSLPIKKP